MKLSVTVSWTRTQIIVMALGGSGHRFLGYGSPSLRYPTTSRRLLLGCEIVVVVVHSTVPVGHVRLRLLHAGGTAVDPAEE